MSMITVPEATGVKMGRSRARCPGELELDEREAAIRLLGPTARSQAHRAG